MYENKKHKCNCTKNKTNKTLINKFLFIGKLIRFFSGKPPIEPNDDPIEINHNLNLPDSRIDQINKYFPESNKMIKGKGVSFVDSLDNSKSPMVAISHPAPLSFDNKQLNFIAMNPELKDKMDTLNKIDSIQKNVIELSAQPESSLRDTKLKFLFD